MEDWKVSDKNKRYKLLKGDITGHKLCGGLE